IFLDPPFDGQDLPRVLDLIAERSLLRPGGCVYFEQARRAGGTAPGPGWQTLKHGHAGATQ
ncbi:MAG: 16S rRNA (guanine(966)-N(2))-methyltransferase RsmD, partial [Pseudomonas stutzeri]|nr:16S rRNA (guanine(966)-N(2))-methyltransferase RsmD [Stutzerimonas stutzeri]NIO13957.1 16S rRNA (guanine(966)-N(2))-methyltransferase RsmD [Xanthomonadales bacterium]NIN81845.1 16S rRNA (guanine(966)-N(2))-methyltransferase RsmD [Stutzerimonas stutzeri]NIP01078.1 16S rRNA (guanine(966)-N(2))-methyltransferase RsmD [Stutzerimonas stutzeri]NIQ23690.1 16S rRNA (guanine(966)-N(2))-methyltransferase RsmD [Stutzerimonas stutzeri]